MIDNMNMSLVAAPALNALSPEQALAAWKRINSTVRNPLFSGRRSVPLCWFLPVQRLRGVHTFEAGA